MATRQLILGSAVGLVGGLLSWRGNREPHLVSTFPDTLTFLVFLVLITSVVWLELGRQAVPNRSAALRLGAVIGSAAGVVFGTVLIVLGVFQFTRPFVTLLAFGFVGAIVISVAFGLLAAFAWSLTQRRPA